MQADDRTILTNSHRLYRRWEFVKTLSGFTLPGCGPVPDLTGGCCAHAGKSTRDFKVYVNRAVIACLQSVLVRDDPVDIRSDSVADKDAVDAFF